jgi:hypothetical protein
MTLYKFVWKAGFLGHGNNQYFMKMVAEMPQQHFEEGFRKDFQNK